MFPTINGIDIDNRPKIDESIKLIKTQCQNRDVFLGADEKGELTIQVQRTEPLMQLLDPEVAAHIDLNPKEMLALITMAMNAKAQHINTYNEKLPVFRSKTKGIDKMDGKQIAMKIQETIASFNEKFKEPLN